MGVLVCLGLWFFPQNENAPPEKQNSAPWLLTAGYGAHSAAAEHSLMKQAVLRRPLALPILEESVPLDSDGINAAARSPEEITVSKSGGFVLNRAASKPRWNFLGKATRAKIDTALKKPRRWRYMVLHSSATSSGSAKAFDYYHQKVKGMTNGMAYHFVIGNGRGSRDGLVEVGGRWAKQIPGGHLSSSAQNDVAIGICFVGDFQKSKPTPRQQEAADELIDYLQAKLGKIPVTIHRRINTKPTLCPGRNFPTGLFVEGKIK